ncbi:YhdT family protein [Neobacillus sp. WH10]|uniref:YhdT family protein n=1 Tax=Neobacillus sp. WH10 TaxID=3047873 RepID=UPI0024C183BE|nr:YhdT family protein [Neobacillus sp. WH10]WHY76847.1 YhdT family protein [Neobacillus sp. WH10]
MKHTVHPLDKRFKIAHREALIGVVLVIINFIWWYGFAYGLGSDKVEKYTYIFGFPAWFFYSCIAGFVVMVILVILTVKFLFKDVPFEEEEGNIK